MGWDKVSSSNKRKGPSKCELHLCAYPNECEDMWNEIRRLTKSDKLGYMSSKSPGVMEWGNLEGAYTITVHYNAGERHDVTTALGSLCRYIYKEKP